jgi:hypothetical protein
MIYYISYIPLVRNNHQLYTPQQLQSKTRGPKALVRILIQTRSKWRDIHTFHMLVAHNL